MTNLEKEFNSILLALNIAVVIWLFPNPIAGLNIAGSILCIRDIFKD